MSNIMSSSDELKEYAAYCPSCGNKLMFNEPYVEPSLESIRGKCSNISCKRKWSMIFDIDDSGTFVFPV